MPAHILTEPEFTAVRDRVLQAAPPGLDEAGFHRYIGSAMAQAIGEAENTPVAPEGSAIGRAASSLYENSPLAPIVNTGKGIVNAVVHPLDTWFGMAPVASTAKDLLKAQWDEGVKAAQKAKEATQGGGVLSASEALGHGLAAILPILGPAAARVGEQGASGDLAGMAGGAVGLTAPLVAHGVVEAKSAGSVPDLAKADRLTREATAQVADRVLAPANPRYKGVARTLSSQILDRGLQGDRITLQQIAEEGMHDAGARIDAAVQAAGGPSAPIPAAEVVAPLKTSIADLQDSSGTALSTQAGMRIQALNDRIAQLQALAGRAGTVTFADLKKLRDENYRIANEARGYEQRGNPAMADEGWAARETGSAIRQVFADRSPDAAAANADYTFHKSLADVLDPVLGRPKTSTVNQTGVTGGAMTQGAVIGSALKDVPGLGVASALFVGKVLPLIQQAQASPAWQLASAAKKLELADAIRQGQTAKAQGVLLKIISLAPRTSTASPLAASIETPSTPQQGQR